MKKGKLLFCVLLVSILGCQPDPGEKLIAKEDKVLVDKSLNDITFDPTVDILFIIDDSGSMASAQTKLASNAQLFIDQFFQATFINYHIGVTTSTEGWIVGPGQGGSLTQFKGHNFVERKTPDASIVLKTLMQVGTSGDSFEKFLSIPMLTFSQNNLAGPHKDYYRPNAHLAIFILTDTEDQSDVSATQLYEFLLELKKHDERKVHIAAAIIEKSQTNCSSENDYPPSKIINLTTLAKQRGYKIDMCKVDYGTDLAKIATDLIRAASTIYLEKLPDVTTLQVFYGDEQLPNNPDTGWVYDPDENAIYLAPNNTLNDVSGKKLKVKYESIY